LDQCNSTSVLLRDRMIGLQSLSNVTLAEGPFIS
jgi:hypothetical protein